MTTNEKINWEKYFQPWCARGNLVGVPKQVIFKTGESGGFSRKKIIRKILKSIHMKNCISFAWWTWSIRKYLTYGTNINHLQLLTNQSKNQRNKQIYKCILSSLDFNFPLWLLHSVPWEEAKGRLSTEPFMSKTIQGTRIFIPMGPYLYSHF